MVIIDDMISLGLGFSFFLNDATISALQKYKKIYYVTLTKNPKIEFKFKNILPNLEFISYKNLEEYNSDTNEKYTKEKKEKIKQFIKKYDHKINPIMSDKLPELNIFLTFEWNTPENTPLLFRVNSDKWKCLFPRYNGAV